MQENRYERIEGKQDCKSPVRELKEELERSRPDLVVNKVPKETLRVFKNIANEEFHGDYGTTLKILIDYYANDIKFISLLERLELLEGTVDILQDSLMTNNKEDNGTQIRALDGTIIR